MSDPIRIRHVLVPAALVFLTLLPSAASGSMCNTDGAASPALGKATAAGSAKFLEAASQGLLVFKAIEEGSDAFESHTTRARALLDEAISDYKRALALADDLAQLDQFLRQRPFERLRASFGITPGTIPQRQWELLAKTARESKTPGADFIKVCISGAELLKSVAVTAKPGLQPAQLRRVASTWYLVLMHGSMVSDAFDASVQ